METFFNSVWFNVAKSALLAIVVGMTTASANGQAHFPEWLTPILAAAYGLLQSGQKKP